MSIISCSGDEIVPGDTFIKFYGADGGYTLADLTERGDNEPGVVMFGTREELEGERLGEKDFYVLITDAEGKVVRSSDDLLFTDGTNEIASRITKLDNGYLVIGTIRDFVDGNELALSQIVYIRLNEDLSKNGDWVILGDGASNYFGVDINITADGGVVVAGHTNVNGTNDFYYQKIGGTNPWTRIQTRAASNDVLVSLIDNGDGTFALFGQTDAGTGDGEIGVNVEATIIDGEGIIQNSFTYGIELNGELDIDDVPMDAVKRAGGYAIVGTSTLSTTDFQPFVMLVDLQGAKKYEKIFTNSEIANGYGLGIAQLSNKDYFLVGSNADVGNNQDQALIIKLDQDGEVKNNTIKNYGLVNGNEQAVRALSTDGSSVYIGATYEFGTGGLKQFALLKVNSSGDLKK